MKLLFAGLVVMFSWTAANAMDWRGILPLHSHRSDVERLLGPPWGECKCLYDAGSETVRVDYAKAPCVGYPSGWNVSADTVLRIHVTSAIPKKFSDLKLATADFNKSADDIFTTYYSTRAEGMEYVVSWDGTLNSIVYFPSNKDSALRCPCAPMLDESIQRSTSFDQFGLKAINDLLARLDNFIIELQNNDRWTGFILWYSGKKTSRKQISVYEKSIRRHVMQTRGVPAHRVKLIAAGYRTEPEIELFLLPVDFSPPEPRATWAPCRK